MRTAAVVIVNAGRQQGRDISDTPECQVGQQLVLDRRVDPFRPGVVLWIAILGHADEDAVALQYVDILFTRILHSAVTVMYQAPDV